MILYFILCGNFRTKKISARRTVAVIKKKRPVLMKQHTVLRATRPEQKLNLGEMKAGKKPARKMTQERSRRRRLYTLPLNQMYLRNPSHQIHLRILVVVTPFKSHQINTLRLLKRPWLLMDLKCPTLHTHLEHKSRRPQVLRRDKMPCICKVFIFCTVTILLVTVSTVSSTMSTK